MRGGSVPLSVVVDRESLNAMFVLTNGPHKEDGWTVLGGWGEDSVGVCEWHGVKCATHKGELRVEVIQVDRNNVQVR